MQRRERRYGDEPVTVLPRTGFPPSPDAGYGASWADDCPGALLEHTEHLAVRGGAARLVLRVGDADLALLHDEEPVVVAWEDPTAPGFQTVLRAHDLADLDLAAGTLDLADATVREALRPLLAGLPDGRYRVDITDTPDVANDRALRPEAPTPGRVVDWAGLLHLPTDEAALVGTVPRDLVDDARVDALVAAIRGGALPAVVALTAEDLDISFVVAGHAAMEAWRRLGRPPLLITLEALDAPALEASVACRLVEAACAHACARVAAHHRATRPRGRAGAFTR